MTVFQAVILGLLQGITELFPISSLGHSVLIPPLFHWPFDQSKPSFLVFLVATHFATALVLLGFYWREWIAIMFGMLRSLQARNINGGGSEGRIGWLLVVGTIPAGLLGVLFEERFRQLFASPRMVAMFLLGNGILLYAAELLRRHAPSSTLSRGDDHIADLSWAQALFIGCMQSLALFPGFSRTGAALSGGLLTKLSHEAAARFAFLLATPIILAAAVLKLPELAGSAPGAVIPVVAGSLCAALAAYLSVRFLTHYFKAHTLMPFAVYCVIAALGCVFLLS